VKQIVQNYRSGALSVEEVPVPGIRSGSILVKTLSSVISLGSEKAAIDFSKKNLVGKAMSRPDLVKQVINRAKKEGIVSTVKHALERLDVPLPLGYSSAGVVLEVGSGSSEFKVGDMVALNATGYASHSEYTVVPFKLAAKVPAGVKPEYAAFTTLGAIALQGVRNAEASPGSIIAVFGLGLLGLITIQILKAYGYQVIGVEPDGKKLRIASELGVGLVVKPDGGMAVAVENWTEGYGADCAIITAAARDNTIIGQATSILRPKGRIVMVGVTGMELDRRQFYDKELSFVVSKSTGPGKADPVYELDGVDYPHGLVRWTQKRNMAEIIRLMVGGLLNLEKLITHRIPIGEALQFYQRAHRGEISGAIGAVITYPEVGTNQIDPGARKMVLAEPRVKAAGGTKEVKEFGLIGAGLFGKNVLYPLVKANPRINLKALATASGLSAADVGKKLGVEYVTTDFQQILGDPNIEAVMILTRHAQHGPMIIEALQAGKAVYVEKPLAATPESLLAVKKAQQESQGLVMTGFCRRYSPAGVEMQRLLQEAKGPKVIGYRVNAGYIPPMHWVQREPGGRIVGEVCHFVDFICALTGSLPYEVSAACLTGEGNLSMSDNLTVTLRMDCGSIGNILYCANGNKSFSREYIEVFSGGTVLINEDFRRVTFYNENKTYKKKWLTRDMGYKNEIEYFVKMLDGSSASTFERDVVVTKATFAILRALETSEWVRVTAMGDSATKVIS
jgi:predicted dehydrogenase/threonine dehydrogenase-like Zn-dependent dehydrogenase